MNVLTNEEPLKTFDKFRGLWARGDQDTCPPDHLSDCYNCSFPSPEQVFIRERFTIQSTIAGRQYKSFAIGQLKTQAVLLTLDANGVLRDETNSKALGSVTTADDFTILNVFGRIYVSFKEKGRASQDSPVFVYEDKEGGGTTFRATGWWPPSTAPDPIEISPPVGNVDVGYHHFAIAFVSPSGYISGPSPTDAIAITETGKNIRVTNIPVGPPGTIARRVLATKANESELFFAGEIPNNNAGVEFDFGLPDSALISSADYLNDIYGGPNFPLPGQSGIPGCAALKFYRGRVVYIGCYNAPDDILVSRQQDPETVSLTENVVHLPVNYGISTSVGGLVIRAVLYVTKPNSTYSIQDNGDNPNTWGVDCVDAGIGAYDAGLSMFASDMSAQDVIDSSLVCNKRGLTYFTGQYTDVPLSYKIENIWRLIDENFFYNVQIAHDVWRKRAYIAVPLNPATSHSGLISRNVTGDNNMLLMMDYSDGLTPQSVQWSVWTGDNKPYKKIGIEHFTLGTSGNQNLIYHFATVNGGPHIWKISHPMESFPQLQDDMGGGTWGNIWQWVTTAPVSQQGVTTFKMLDLSIDGNGILQVRIMPNRRAFQQTVRPFNLDRSAVSNVDLQRLINMMNESLQVMIIADPNMPGGYNGGFLLNTVRVWGTKMYNMRPAVTINVP